MPVITPQPSAAHIQISIILCAHNPRTEYLTRTLDALKKQTLSREQWELLLVDNASTRPLKDVFDLSWHPHGRCLREDAVGKTNAFLLGVRESSGGIIMIVDDDNLLAPDYLEKALQIGLARPQLGSWGGNVKLCFEQTPPDWTRRYWPLLAGREVHSDEMVCNLELTEPLPVGAGCCVRRKVADHYATLQNDAWRPGMGRVGRGLVSGEDTDLAMTACDLGLYRGMFKDLSLDHIIPPGRLTEDYLLRMVEGVRFSCYLLELARHSNRVPPPITLWWRVKFLAVSLCRFARRPRFLLAYKRAQKSAREYYEKQIGKR